MSLLLNMLSRLVRWKDRTKAVVLALQCVRAPGEGLIKCRTGSVSRVPDSADVVGPQNLHSPTSPGDDDASELYFKNHWPGKWKVWVSLRICSRCFYKKVNLKKITLRKVTESCRLEGVGERNEWASSTPLSRTTWPGPFVQVVTGIRSGEVPKAVENKHHVFLAFPAFDPVSGFNYLHCFYSHVSR